VFVLFGLFLSAGYLFIAVTAAPHVLGFVVRLVTLISSEVPLEAFVIVWNWVGVLLLLIFAGSFGFWVWIREFYRLPYFLDVWGGRNSEELCRPPSRPTGFVLPTVTCWLLAVIPVFFDVPVLRRAFALLWPVTMIGGLWTVISTYNRVPQSFSNENWWIYGGFVLQIMALWLGTTATDVASLVTGQSSNSSVLIFPSSLLVLLLIVFAIPTVERYEREHDDIRRFGLVGLLLLLGILAAGSRSVLPPKYRVFAVGLAVVGSGFGILLGIVRYFDL
jgi:hypothetical protein